MAPKHASSNRKTARQVLSRQQRQQKLLRLAFPRSRVFQFAFKTELDALKPMHPMLKRGIRSVCTNVVTIQELLRKEPQVRPTSWFIRDENPRAPQPWVQHYYEVVWHILYEYAPGYFRQGLPGYQTPPVVSVMFDEVNQSAGGYSIRDLHARIQENMSTFRNLWGPLPARNIDSPHLPQGRKRYRQIQTDRQIYNTVTNGPGPALGGREYIKINCVGYNGQSYELQIVEGPVPPSANPNPGTMNALAGTAHGAAAVARAVATQGRVPVTAPPPNTAAAANAAAPANSWAGRLRGR